MDIAKDFSWLKHHLAMLVIVAVLVIGSVYGVESLISRHDHDRAIELQTIAQQMAQQNLQVQQQTQAQIASLTQQNIALQQQVGTLISAISARDTQLRQTQAQVPQLSPTQLSEEWKKQLKGAGDIRPTPTGYAVDATAAIATVQALESVPVLQQDVSDLNKTVTNLNQQISNETQKFDAEVKAHTSDNDANKAVIVAKDAEIKDIKAKARKKNIMVAVLAFIGGMVANKFGI